MRLNHFKSLSQKRIPNSHKLCHLNPSHRSQNLLNPNPRKKKLLFPKNLSFHFSNLLILLNPPRNHLNPLSNHLNPPNNHLNLLNSHLNLPSNLRKNQNRRAAGVLPKVAVRVKKLDVRLTKRLALMDATLSVMQDTLVWESIAPPIVLQTLKALPITVRSQLDTGEVLANQSRSPTLSSLDSCTTKSARRDSSLGDAAIARLSVLRA